jgi:UDP-glucose 4-epimerase
MNILVTGGAGYIGSHTLIELSKAGHTFVAVDDLSNAKLEALRRVEQIIGKPVPFYQSAVQDKQKLEDVFSEHAFDAVIHFAGYKFVGESVEKPTAYYQNNLDSTLVLLEVMQQNNVNSIIFSSSSTVYGNNPDVPLSEDSQTGVGLLNPYAWSKAMNEQILTDVAKANPDLRVVLLRYFNPVGAHESGLIGEDPQGVPNNLLPYVTQVAQGIRERLTIYGNDYPTPDGTCIRDYIHVVDLAAGHVAAVENATPGSHIFNLGTGTGTSVLELIHAFERATGQTVPHAVGPRREGDITTSYGNVDKAAKDLGWRAQKSVEQACKDAWRWQSQNPSGYGS